MAVELEKTRSLRSTLDELDVDSDNLFHESFLQRYTSFNSFNEFVGTFKGRYRNQADPFDVTVEDADRVVQKQTDFDSWFQMLEKAVAQWWEHPDRDRRSHRRYQCNVDVRFRIGEQEFEARMLDISKSGLRITTEETVPNTRIIDVTVPLDAFKGREGYMEVRAAVRWRENDPKTSAMGLEILSKQTVSG